MDNIEKRGNKYRVRIYKQSEKKRKGVSKTFDNLKDAIRWRDAQRLIDTPTLEPRTFDEVMADYLEMSPNKPQTKRKHRVNYNRYIAPYVGRYTLDDVPIKSLQRALNAMRDNCSQNVIDTTTGLIRSLYSFAIRYDYAITDKSAKLEKPKSNQYKPHKRKECDNVNEVIKVLESGDELHQIIAKAVKVGYYLGLRPQELLAINSEQIDPQRRLLTIDRSISHDEQRKPYISRTKTEASIRILPYPKQLDETLKGKGQLFTYKGELIDAKRCADVFKVCCKGFSLYQLRHGFASRCVNSGVDVKTIQKLMGHSSPVMSLDYAESKSGEMEKAVEMVAK